MQTTIAKLLLTFFLLFSLQSFSQTATPKSKHPKMDAYYPPKPAGDTTQAVTNQAPPVPTATVTSTPSAITPPPVATTAPVTTPPVTTPVVTPPPPPPPVATTVQPPAPKKVPAPPPPSPYLDTRLGSSTPQYDTWDKNNNGAGSVTTSPK